MRFSNLNISVKIGVSVGVRSSPQPTRSDTTCFITFHNRVSIVLLLTTFPLRQKRLVHLAPRVASSNKTDNHPYRRPFSSLGRCYSDYITPPPPTTSMHFRPASPAGRLCPVPAGPISASTSGYGAISENSVTSTEISRDDDSMERPEFLAKIDFEFEVHPVVAILGPRQCGKTTLARMYADRLDDESVTRFDLEDPTHLARLETPKLAPEGNAASRSQALFSMAVSWSVRTARMSKFGKIPHVCWAGGPFLRGPC